MNASTGEVAGAAVNADLTVTMHGPKVGLAVAPGRFHAGEVAVADIGLEPADTEHKLVTAEFLAEVPRRSARDNKSFSIARKIAEKPSSRSSRSTSSTQSPPERLRKITASVI